MRNIEELEGLTKEEMSSEEYELREAFINRLISIILRLGFGEEKTPAVFEKTTQLLIFQESVMKICQYGAGFTLNESDDIRRAMGKKKADVMMAYKEQFINGWNENVGIFANEIWDKMVEYAKYCFNKSHAVAYTLVTIKTAELCNENNIDYMLFNYFNNPKKKSNAINQLIQNGRIQFPEIQNWMRGIIISLPKQSIEVKPLFEIDEVEEDNNDEGNIENENENQDQNTEEDNDQDTGDTNTENKDETAELKAELEAMNLNNFHKLFMANIPGTIKLELIQRGIYDTITLDIHGLVLLNKALGTKAQRGFKIPEELYNGSDTLGSLFNVLKISGWIDYIETPDYISFSKITKQEPVYNPAKAEKIMKNRKLGQWDPVKTIYRMKSIKKQFGIAKFTGLTAYDPSKMENVERAVENINKVVQRVLDNNPGKKIGQKDFDNIVKKIPKIWDTYTSKKSALENFVMTAYVQDKKILKNGNCIVCLIFADDYKEYKYYINKRDSAVINGIQKGAVHDFVIELSSYMGRNDSLFKIYPNIKLYLE